MIRKQGGKRWRLLHRLVYVCAIGGVMRDWWLVKKDPTNPIHFCDIVGDVAGYPFALLAWESS